MPDTPAWGYRSRDVWRKSRTERSSTPRAWEVEASLLYGCQRSIGIRARLPGSRRMRQPTTYDLACAPGLLRRSGASETGHVRSRRRVECVRGHPIVVERAVVV